MIGGMIKVTAQSGSLLYGYSLSATGEGSYQ